MAFQNIKGVIMRKVLKILLIVSVLVLSIAGFAACNDDNGNKTENDEFKMVLSQTEKEIGVDESFDITVQVYKNDVLIENPQITWESDNAQIATVENGKVTGKGLGKAVISATYEDVIRETCTVTVTQVLEPGYELNLSSNNIQLFEGQKFKVGATVTCGDEEVPDAQLTWTSADEAIATVTGGEVLGVKYGETVITASYNTGSETLSRTVAVKVNEPYQIILSTDELTLDTKDNNTAEVSGEVRSLLDSSLVEGAEIEWQSADASVVTVADGVVTVTGHGSTQITASYSTVSAFVEVTVWEAPLRNEINSFVQEETIDLVTVKDAAGKQIVPQYETETIGGSAPYGDGYLKVTAENGGEISNYLYVNSTPRISRDEFVALAYPNGDITVKIRLYIQSDLLENYTVVLLFDWGENATYWATNQWHDVTFAGNAGRLYDTWVDKGYIFYTSGWGLTDLQQANITLYVDTISIDALPEAEAGEINNFTAPGSINYVTVKDAAGKQITPQYETETIGGEAPYGEGYLKVTAENGGEISNYLYVNSIPRISREEFVAQAYPDGNITVRIRLYIKSDLLENYAFCVLLETGDYAIPTGVATNKWQEVTFRGNAEALYDKWQESGYIFYTSGWGLADLQQANITLYVDTISLDVLPEAEANEINNFSTESTINLVTVKDAGGKQIGPQYETETIGGEAPYGDGYLKITAENGGEISNYLYVNTMPRLSREEFVALASPDGNITVKIRLYIESALLENYTIVELFDWGENAAYLATNQWHDVTFAGNAGGLYDAWAEKGFIFYTSGYGLTDLQQANITLYVDTIQVVTA